ncbi:LuxR C-terminal-related transcriptional regulator [Cellulomonas cellasea]|uniref:Putative ATPase/DNA-binding CsgD family transcriptional regulator n=1 Tax=Cellulomonas cellasea TaxID=43670 RepID=A0A7W4YAX1_9CELL|nr:LuxR C-terminal-related transcriptional regulator [Cellulomonas cellasea]MBB2923033.1 putative ATPase/DNA-binding CsgD family transcriptional regulator [Cellulomonas cellasea]
MAATGWHGVTPREGAVLSAVAHRLTNAEIAAELHLSVRTVESHVAALRRKLGAQSRADLIAAEHARRGSGVPVPRNSFVGRSGSLGTLRTLLVRSPWVTVVGPAGCGKTRLALELAAAGTRVPVVVELAHAAPGDVPRALAHALGLTPAGGVDVVAACVVALDAASHLLVLDDADHVADAVRQLVGGLLGAAGAPVVVVTSRTPLGGPGETVLTLAALSADPEDEDGAVRLFTDRARAADPRGWPADVDRARVSRVCARLDGLPLAIELAAARVRHVGLDELEHLLDAGPAPLDRAGDGGRHGTLEAAIGWTWDLLDPEELRAIERLAALTGTFDLDVAQAVGAAAPVVLRLLDRSLVVPASPAPEDDRRRFRLLTSLRAFVLARSDPAVLDAARDAHAAHAAATAHAAAEHARTDDSPSAVRAARLAVPEAAVALRWCVGRGHPGALALAHDVAVLLEQYGARADGLDALDSAARDAGVRAAADTATLFAMGEALCFSDVPLAADLAGLALARATGPRSALEAHHLAALVEAYRDRGAAALEHAAAAERLATEQGDLWRLAGARQARGIALRGADLDDPAAALDAFGSAMTTYARAGDGMHVHNNLYMRASCAVAAGVDPGQAVAWADECAAYARARGNQHELAHAQLTRASLTALRPGTDPGTDVALDEAVASFRAVGDLRCLTRAYLALAARRGPSGAAPLLERALGVATTARDHGQQLDALTRLVDACWTSGARRRAVVLLARLVGLVGIERARELCPGGLLPELDGWAEDPVTPNLGPPRAAAP